MDLRVTGADDLERVGKRLREVGAGDLRKELLRGIREAGKPVILDVRKSALETLPRRGGLAALVAKSKFATRTRVSGKNVGVQIKGTGKNPKSRLVDLDE